MFCKWQNFILFFKWLNNIPFCICTTSSLFSSIDGHLGCFNILATVNNAAMNIEVHVSFQIIVFVFFGKILKSGIAKSYGSSIFNFWGTTILFSIVAAPIYNPTNSLQGFPFSTSSPAFAIPRLFDDGHFNRPEVISHCGFNLHFHQQWSRVLFSPHPHLDSYLLNYLLSTLSFCVILTMPLHSHI